MPIDFTDFDPYSTDIQSEPELPQDDFSSAAGIIQGQTWNTISREDRLASREGALKKIRSYYEEDKTRTVKVRDDQGEEKEMKLWYPDGGLSDFGMEFFEKQKNAVYAAASAPTGGTDFNPVTGKMEIEPALSGYTSNHYVPRAKRAKGPFSKYDEAAKELGLIEKDGKPPALTFDQFVEYNNKDLPEDSPARLDPENENLKNQFKSYQKLRNFDPKSLGDKYISEVEGHKQFNPDKIHDIDGMLAAIESYDAPASEKHMMTERYRKIVNAAFGEMIKEAGFAEGLDWEWAKGGVAAPAWNALGGAMKDMVGMDRQDLFSRYQRFAADPENGDAFEFLKQNADLFQKDGGWADKLNVGLYKAFASTGTGMAMLASGFQWQAPKDWAIGVDEVTAGAYDGLGADGEWHGPMGIHLTEKGVYDLAGQVISILATGGASAVIKGLVSSGTRIAGQAAAGVAAKSGLATFAGGAARAGGGLAGGIAGGAIGGEIGEAIGGERGEQIGGLAGSLLGSATGFGGVSALKGRGLKTKFAKVLKEDQKAQMAIMERLAPETAKSFWGSGGKMSRYAQQALRDPSAYIGSLQAGGMSYGATYNQVLQATGDRDLAAKKATIRSISDMASAYIATAVFNRVAAGAEGAMAGPRGLGGSLGTSINRQTFTSALKGKFGMESMKSLLREAVTDEGLLKALGKGMSEVVGRKATAMGMRKWVPGMGVVAETMEETVDTILSDVFNAALDDSETWNESVWENLEEKIGEYLSAGIMGAFGGGLGGTFSVPAEYIAANTEARKEFIKKQAELTWQGIKGDFESFDPNVTRLARTAGVDQASITMAEYIANSNDSVEEKSQKVLEHVLSSSMSVDMADLMKPTSSKEDDEEATEAAESEPKAPEGDDTKETPKTAQKPSSSQGEASQLLKALKLKAPAGMQMKSDLVPIPKRNTKGEEDSFSLGDNGSLTPVSLAGHNRVGAKHTKADGTVEYVSPEKAIELLGEVKGFTKTGSAKKEQQRYKQATKLDERQIRLDLAEPIGTSPEPSEGSGDAAGDTSGDSQNDSQEVGNQQAAKGAQPKQTPSKGSAKPTEDLNKLPSRQEAAVKGQKILDSLEEGKYEIQRAGKKGILSISRNLDGKTTAIWKFDGEAGPVAPEVMVEHRGSAMQIPKGGKIKDATEVARKSEGVVIKGRVDQASDPSNDQSQSSTKEEVGWVEQTITKSDKNRNEIAIDKGVNGYQVRLNELKERARKEDDPKGPEAAALAHMEALIESKRAKEQFAATPEQAKAETSAKQNLRNVDVFVESDLIEGGEDAAGGRWEKSQEVPGAAEQRRGGKDVTPMVYRYTPPKGAMRNPNDFAVVSIYGNESEVLLLTGTEGRELVYKKVDLASSLEGQGIDTAALEKGSRHWQASRLNQIADELKKFMPKLLGKGELTEEEFEKAFNAVLRLVAPNFKPKEIVHRELKKGFIFVESRVEESGRSAKNEAMAKADKEMVAAKERTEAAKRVRDGDLNNPVEADMELAGISFEGVDADPEQGITLEQAREKAADLKLRFLRDKEESANAALAKATKDLEVIGKTVSEPVIVLDRKKFQQKLASLFQGYTAGKDAFNDRVVGMEIGRQMAAWIDEEQIHRVAIPMFKADELEGFVDDGLSGDSRVANIRRLIEETVTERFGEGKDVNALTPEEKQNISHEVIRKLVQFTTTGSTAEIQMADSREVVALLNENENDKKNGKIKTLIALLKRYWGRMRNILTLRHLRKEMTGRQQVMLTRILDAYKQEGLRGDVDLMNAKQRAQAETTYTNAIEAAQLRANKFITQQKLFSTIDSFRSYLYSNNLPDLDDSVILNPDTGEIRLVPIIKEFMEKNAPTVDVEALEEAFNLISEENLAADAVSVLVAAQDRLQAARDALPTGSANGDTIIDALARHDKLVKKSKDTLTDVERMALSLDGATKSDFEPIERWLRMEIESINQSIEAELKVADREAISDVINLNPKKLSDMKQLLSLANKLGLSRFEGDRSDPDNRLAAQELIQLVANRMNSLTEQEGESGFITGNNGAAAQLLNPSIMVQFDERFKKRERIEQAVARADEMKATAPVVSPADDLGGFALSGYLNALADFNDSVKQLTARAMGSYRFNDGKREQTFENVSDPQNPVTIDPLTLPSNLDGVTGATYVSAGEMANAEIDGVDKPEELAKFKARFYGAQGPRPSVNNAPALRSRMYDNMVTLGKLTFEAAVNLPPTTKTAKYLANGGFGVEMDQDEFGFQQVKGREIMPKFEMDDIFNASRIAFPRDNNGNPDYKAISTMLEDDLDVGKRESYADKLNDMKTWALQMKALVAKDGPAVFTMDGVPTIAARFSPLIEKRMDEVIAAAEAHLTELYSLKDRIDRNAGSGKLDRTLKSDTEKIFGYRTGLLRQTVIEAALNANSDLAMAAVALDTFSDPWTRNGVRQERRRQAEAELYELPSQGKTQMLEDPVGSLTDWVLKKIEAEDGVDLSKNDFALAQIRQAMTAVADSEAKQSVHEIDLSPLAKEGIELTTPKIVMTRQQYESMVYAHASRPEKPIHDQNTLNNYSFNLRLLLLNQAKYNVNSVMAMDLFNRFELAANWSLENKKLFQKSGHGAAMGKDPGAALSENYLYSYKDKDADGSPLAPFSIGQQDPMGSDWQILQSERDVDAPERVGRQAFTEAALLIGAQMGNGTKEDSNAVVDAALKFVDDLLRLDELRLVEAKGQPENRGKKVGMTEAQLLAFKAIAGVYGRDIQAAVEGRSKILSAGRPVQPDAFVEEKYAEFVATYGNQHTDPVQLIKDVVYMKAAAEQRYLDNARIEADDAVVRALTTLAAETKEESVKAEFEEIASAFELKHGRPFFPDTTKSASTLQSDHSLTDQEASAILRQLRRDMNKGKKMRLFDMQELKQEAEVSEFPFLYENTAAASLVQAIPGEVVVYSPDYTVFPDESPIGSRIIPGKNGGPTIIYAPRNTFKKDSNSYLVAKSLQLIAKSSPETAQAIADFGAEAMDKLSFVNRMRQTREALNHDVREHRRIAEAFGEKIVAGMNMNDGGKKATVAAIQGHLLRLMDNSEAQVAIDNALDYADKNGVIAGSTMLISELLTNPKLKLLYDQLTYEVGIPQVHDHGLNENQSTNLLSAIYDASRNAFAQEDKTATTDEAENRDVGSIAEEQVDEIDGDESEAYEKSIPDEDENQEMVDEFVKSLSEAHLLDLMGGETILNEEVETEEVDSRLAEYDTSLSDLRMGKPSFDQTLKIMREAQARMDETGVTPEDALILNSAKMGLVRSKQLVELLIKKFNHDPEIHTAWDSATFRLLDEVSKDFGDAGMSQANAELFNVLSAAVASGKGKEEARPVAPLYRRTDTVNELIASGDPALGPVLEGRNEGAGTYYVGHYGELSKRIGNTQSKMAAAMQKNRTSQMAAGLLLNTDQGKAQTEFILQDRKLRDKFDKLDAGNVELYLNVDRDYLGDLQEKLPNADRMLEEKQPDGTIKKTIHGRLSAAITEERQKIKETLQTYKLTQAKLDKLREQKAELIAQIAQSKKDNQSFVGDTLVPTNPEMREMLVENVVSMMDNYIVGTQGYASAIRKTADPLSIRAAHLMAGVMPYTSASDAGKAALEAVDRAATAEQAYFRARTKRGVITENDENDLFVAGTSENQALNRALGDLEYELNVVLSETLDQMVGGPLGLQAKQALKRSLEDGGDFRLIKLPRMEVDRLTTYGQIRTAINELALNPSPEVLAGIVKSGLTRFRAEKGLSEGLSDVLVSAIQKMEQELSGQSEGINRLAAGKLNAGIEFDARGSKYYGDAQKAFDGMIREVRSRFRGAEDRAEARAFIRQALEVGFVPADPRTLPAGASPDTLLSNLIDSLLPSSEARASIVEGASESTLYLSSKKQQVEAEIARQTLELEKVGKDVRNLLLTNARPMHMGWANRKLYNANGNVEKTPYGTEVRVNANVWLAPPDFTPLTPATKEEVEKEKADYVNRKFGEMEAAFEAGEEIDFSHAARVVGLQREVSGFVRNEMDETYKLIKGDNSFSSNFDVSRMVEAAIERSQLESQLVEARMQRMRDEAEGKVPVPGVGTLGVDVLTALTSPRMDVQLNSVETALTVANKKINAIKERLVVAKAAENELAQAKKPTATNKSQRKQLSDKHATQQAEVKAIIQELKEATEERNNLKMDETRAKRVKRWQLPKNREARKEAIARIINIDGEYVALSPITIGEDMKRVYEKQGKKAPNMKQIVLEALDPDIQAYELQALDPEKVPEFTGVDMEGRQMSRINYSKDYLDKEFGMDVGLMGGRSTKGMSRREAAEEIEKSFRHFAKQWILSSGVKKVKEEGADQMGAREIEDTEDSLVKEVMDHFGYMVKVIVQSNNHESLSETDQIRVEDFLQKLSVTPTGAMPFHFIRDDENGMRIVKAKETNIINMELMDLFSTVVAKVEGEYIIKTLASGLFKTHKAHEFALMKYVYHEDARFRARFLKDSVALSEAVRLRSILDRGFDGKSGRNGSQAQHQAIADKIAKSLEKVGNSSLDQSKAYVIASLKGIRENRYTLKYGESGHWADLGAWITSFERGVNELEKLQRNNDDRYGNKVNKWVKATHVDLIRDVPMVKEIASLLSKHMDDYHAGVDSPGSQAYKDKAEQLIDDMIKALSQDVAHPEAVESHSQLLLDVFRDVTDATALTKMLMSNPDRKSEYENAGIEISEALSKVNSPVMSWDVLNTTVPLKFQYAAHPDEDNLTTTVEGDNYEDDPLYVVRIEESSIFGGLGSREQKKGNQPFRPINLNGASAVDSMLKDTIYRLNVAPTYGVLRRVLGREGKNSRGLTMVSADAKILETIPDTIDLMKEMKHERAALAAVAREIESIIENDNGMGVYNTGLSETLRVGASFYTVRALLSPWQLVYQTIPAVLGFVIKKLAVKKFGGAGGASMFLSTTSKMVAGSSQNGAKALTMKALGAESGLSDSDQANFASRAADWIKAADPWLSFRGTDGMDPYRSVTRKQRRYGVGRVKSTAGQLIKRLEGIGEWGLDKTIGSGERLLARSIYLTELVGELQEMQVRGVIDSAPETVEQLINMPADMIPTEAKDYARQKVNDMMGVADQSKKGWAFKSHSRNASLQAFLRSAVRFSNHTATTSSNATAMISGVFLDSNADTYGERRMRQESIENVVGTLTQNSLFHVMKAGTFLSLASYLFFLLSGDDEEEAIAKATEFADGLLNPDDEMDSWDDYLKLMTMGKQAIYFQDWRDEKSAARSGHATLTSKVMVELAQVIPLYGLGALMGYMPVNSLAKEKVFNPLSESMWAVGEDMEVAQTNMQKKGVRIYERDGGALETLSNLSAPTAFFHDLAKGLGIGAKSAFLDDSDPFASLMYLLSQVYAPREVRGGFESYLKRKIRDEE